MEIVRKCDPTKLFALTKKEDELETKKNNINQALEAHQVADFFSAKKTIDKSLKNYSVKLIKPNKVKFIPGKVQMNLGCQMLGDLHTVPNFTMVDTYHSEYKDVMNILNFNDDTACIGTFHCQHGQKLQEIKFENHDIRVEREIPVEVFDLAMTKTGEILVSSKSDYLKLYTQTELKTFKSFSPLKTLGVHVTNNNRIIVGLVEYLFLPASKDYIRKLAVINQEGDIHHTIEYDRDGQKMLTYPCRINSFNDKILVVDIINKDEEGRVVMLDYGGTTHLTYKGCESSYSNQIELYPKDVAITTTELILVSDSVNHAIHVLTPAGEVILCKNVKRLGIELPCSLTVDTNEVFWIGCNIWGPDIISKAKISCVKLT